MRMIRAFYEGDASLFHDKQIWAAGEQYRAEHGSHPVIFLSFKDVKQQTVEEAFARLAAVVASEVARFAESAENGLADETKRDSLRKVMRRQGTRDELGESLGLLCEAIEAHAHIDGREYDATFRAEGVADIEKIGLAYCKNQVEICR